MRWTWPAAAAALTLAGCGGLECAKGTHEVDGICVLNLTEAEDVTEICRDAPLDTLRVPISLPAVTEGCPWEQDDNVEAWEGHMTARVEQKRVVDLPPGAVICDLQLDFSGGDPEVPDLEWADQLLLALDGRVLVSSHWDVVGKLELDEDGLPIYDWAELTNQFQPYEAEPWCLGIDEGGWCEIPESGEPGRVSITFPRHHLSTLAWRLLGAESAPLMLTVTGDADAETDCMHEAVDLEVVMPWIPVEELE